MADEAVMAVVDGTSFWLVFVLLSTCHFDDIPTWQNCVFTHPYFQSIFMQWWRKRIFTRWTRRRRSRWTVRWHFRELAVTTVNNCMQQIGNTYTHTYSAIVVLVEEEMEDEEEGVVDAMEDEEGVVEDGTFVSLNCFDSVNTVKFILSFI